jgi:acyl-CoA dehydrogenase
MIDNVYLVENDTHVPGMLETALKLVTKHQKVLSILNKAVKAGQVRGLTFAERIDHAEERKVLTKIQAEHMREYNILREFIISVDDFSEAELRGGQ